MPRSRSATPSRSRATPSTRGASTPRPPSDSAASSLADPQLLDGLTEAAHEAKQRWRGDVVTVARNVFIPLTNLCRDRCTYCTFAKRPGDAGAKSYTLAEVAEVSRNAARARCTEALFCLGDKPELAFRELPRVARRAGLPEHGEVPRRGVSHGGGGGDAPAHQRRPAHAAADGRAAALERVDGADARDGERSALREGRRASRRAGQEARAAPAHAPRGRRAEDPVHDRAC